MAERPSLLVTEAPTAGVPLYGTAEKSALTTPEEALNKLVAAVLIQSLPES